MRNGSLHLHNWFRISLINEGADCMAHIKTFFQQETRKKYACVLGGFLILSLLLEIFIFNFQSLESMSYEEQNVLDQLIVSGDLEQTDDGAYLTTKGTGVLELSDINIPINNLRLKVDTDSERAVKVTISATDAANALPFSTPKRTIWAGEPRTEYLRLHFSGDVQSLWVNIDVNNGETLRIVDCTVNAQKPIFFSFGRFLLVWFIISILYLLRPKSFLYGYSVNLNLTWQRAALIGFVAIQIIAFWSLVNLNPAFVKPEEWPHHYQYHKLTEAFLNGHTYLDKEPTQALKDMENPYDYTLRTKVMAKAGEYYSWDHAYYNEKYYVYFGVVPVLVFYLPYYLITGTHMPTYIALFITSLALIFGVLYLLYHIIKKWFADTPFTIYLILAFIFINSCGIIYILKRPDFYSLPLLMGVVFAIIGVGLWISALREDEMGAPRLSAWRIALGALLIALISGCRPHLLVTMGLGVILFWRSVFHERTLFSKSSIKATLALCIPFIVVAAGIMAYNYVRFDSVFDFGANYNLTTNDMRQRGFVWARSFLGIFSYLFQPTKIEATFPFIKAVSVQTTYLGKTITETMYGGVIFINPFLWLSVFVAFLRKQIAPKQARYVALITPIFALLLVVLDTQIAGILARYQSDFTWLLLLSASIGALALYESWKSDQARRVILGGLMICLVSCFVYHGLEIFAAQSYTLQDRNPQVYYHLCSLIAFWM